MIKKWLPFLLFLPFLSACRKTETGFDMTYTRQFEIPVGLDPGHSHNFVLLNIPSDTSVFFTINNSNAKQLVGVVPRSMVLRPIFQGNGNTFAIVDHIEVFIQDPANVTNELHIFYRNDIPLSVGDNLVLIPDGDNISKYVLDKKNFNVHIKLFFRDFVPASVQVETKFVFLARTS